MIQLILLPILLQITFTLCYPHSQPTQSTGQTPPTDSDLNQEPWTSKYGFQTDLEYTGPLSLMHMEYQRCLSTSPKDMDNRFDIGVIGMPFDTKTSYRPGARFGPFAIRSGSRRLSDFVYDFNYGTSPRALGAKILDCGDVIHFDAHLDTWNPRLFGNTPEEEITHGTFFAIAAREGLMTNTSIHAGIRTRLFGPQDLTYDNETVGFKLISTEDLDDYGMVKILEYVRKRVGQSPVYLSLDVDVIDPSMAPGTGTPEVGGWTTREVKRLIRGLSGLNIVGADVVEVSPSYDHADITGITAADIVYDILNMMQMDTPPSVRRGPLNSQ